MKQTIAREEYLQLLGLMVLAKGHRKALDDIEGAMQGLCGDQSPRGGHVEDEIFGRDQDVDAMLSRMGITVAEKP